MGQGDRVSLSDTFVAPFRHTADTVPPAARNINYSPKFWAREDGHIKVKAGEQIVS